MHFCFMKQFYCAKHRAKLKHDAYGCRYTWSANIALSEIKKVMEEYSMH